MNGIPIKATTSQTTANYHYSYVNGNNKTLRIILTDNEPTQYSSQNTEFGIQQ